MQVEFALSQVEKAAFEQLAAAGGRRSALLALLAYKGVTTKTLAALVGTTPSAVSLFKKGRNISRPMVASLIRLGVPEEIVPPASCLSAEREAA